MLSASTALVLSIWLVAKLTSLRLWMTVCARSACYMYIVYFASYILTGLVLCQYTMYMSYKGLLLLWPAHTCICIYIHPPYFLWSCNIHNYMYIHIYMYKYRERKCMCTCIQLHMYSINLFTYCLPRCPSGKLPLRVWTRHSMCSWRGCVRCWWSSAPPNWPSYG